MYYFIRVNGNTEHKNRNRKDFYAPGEPPEPFYSALEYCFANNIVRIGRPETGDLTARLSIRREAVSDKSCNFNDIPTHIQKYLDTFRKIEVGSIAVVPDKDFLGNVYMAEVTTPYHYFHDASLHPFEFAHRLGVRWDRNYDGLPIVYRAEALGIMTSGGIWIRSFYEIETSRISAAIISRIKVCRRKALPTPANLPASPQPNVFIGNLKTPALPPYISKYHFFVPGSDG